MKAHLKQLLFILLISVSTFLVFSPVSASACCCKHACYSNTQYKYRHCQTVGGYWKHGYWHPAHKVCWVR